MIVSKVALASLLPVCAGEPQGDDAAVSRNFECRPTRRWNVQHVSSGHLEIDVGVVAKNIVRVDCPSDQTCTADATSSLGGRCVSSADASRRMEERLQPCYFTCRDPAVCKAYYHGDVRHDDAEIRNAAISSMASSCRNGDIEECFPDEVVALESVNCPFYECVDDGGERHPNGLTCVCHALEESYNLCKEVYGNLEDLNIDTRCGDYFDRFIAFRYLCEKEGYNHNTFDKRDQLIKERFNECKNRQRDLVTTEEEYTHYVECYCQYQDEMCKLFTDFGWDEELRDSCRRANCCDQRDPEVGFFECVELSFVPYEDGGIESANDDAVMNSAAPITTQIPTDSPSARPPVEASPDEKPPPEGSGKSSASAGSSALALTATVVGVVVSVLNQQG